VSARGAKDDHAAASHVFAAVVADAQDNGADAAVADTEALAGHAADVGFAARCAVESDVADDDVVHGAEGRFRRWIDNDLAAGKSLADVVVGVAFERQCHALGAKSAKALAG